MVKIIILSEWLENLTIVINSSLTKIITTFTSLSKQVFITSLSSFLFNRKENKNKNIFTENIEEIAPTCFSKKFDKKYLKCFYSSKWRKINICAKNLMEHRYFEYFLLGIIVLSCISLVIKIYFINFI
jgi:hypothetical protein